ncbi:MAG: hypothetical protein IJN80_03525, partial [Clostridia bacterium]|nr:hypothetical protein [Clostridia bacterium]
RIICVFCVKILVNPVGLTAFYALQTQKSAPLKFFDLKMSRISDDFWCGEVCKAGAYKPSTSQKALKLCHFRQVRIIRVCLCPEGIRLYAKGSKRFSAEEKTKPIKRRKSGFFILYLQFIP